jgi:phospholipase/carboxylesterase
VKRVRLGTLDAVVAGGPDKDGGGDGPVVVLLHGFGAPGDDLVGLWRQLDVPREVRFVFPEAPLSLDAHFPGMGARAWWMIDLERMQRAVARGAIDELVRDVPEGLAEARAAVDGLLDEVTQTLAPSSLVLGGFSQGAMVSTDVALRGDRALAGLVLLSGTLLADEEWSALAPRRRGLEVLQSHGKSDPLLPFSIAETLRDRLGAAGLQVDFVPFRGGHEIPPQVMDAMGRFLGRVTAPA